jgi:cell surface protein SprA
MKYLLISFVLFAFLFTGCNKEECDPITTTIDDRVSFEINFLQYSDNNYFIDQVYTDTSSALNTYNLYYGSINPIVIPKYFVKSIEVYKAVNSIFDEDQSILANAYINLPTRSSDSMYNDSFRNNNIQIPGEVELSRFILLNEGRDYIFNPTTGFITLIYPINDYDIIAVAYVFENDSPSVSDDLYYGEFISELVNNSKTRGVLKLVRPTNLNPRYQDAWKLKMKNIYQITPYIGQLTNLDMDIYLKKSDGSESNTINDNRLLELFGFDRFSTDGSAIPDGKFDNIIGINFEPRTSEIIFPVIQPFGNNIPSLLSGYKYQAIYDTIKTYLSMPGNSFIIKGKYKPI